MENNINNTGYTERYEYYHVKDGEIHYLYDYENTPYPTPKELLSVAYVAQIGPGSEDVRITVPDEKDGCPISRVILFFEPHAVTTPYEEAEPSVLKYLYIPAGVSGIEQHVTYPKKVNILRLFDLQDWHNVFDECEVEISPYNPYLRAYKNGIYNKDMTELLHVFSPGKNNGGCVEVPEGVTRIKKGAGKAILGLKRLVLPKSLTDIEDEAFEHCIDITELDISVKRIGEMAFSGCRSLVSLRLSDCEEMGRNAFSGCGRLTSVELINIAEISENAFYNCTELKKVSLPETVRRIGNYAFSCTLADELTIPRGVKEVGSVIIGNRYMGMKAIRLDIYVDDDLQPLFSYAEGFVIDGTHIAVHSEKTDEILFEFIKMGNIKFVLTNNGVDFKKYDKLFENKERLKMINNYLKTLAAMYRLRYPMGMSEETREFIKKFASKYGESVLREIIKSDSASGGEIAEHPFLKLIDDDRLFKLIDKTAKKHKAEITAVLLQEQYERKTAIHEG